MSRLLCKEGKPGRGYVGDEERPLMLFLYREREFGGNSLPGFKLVCREILEISDLSET